MSFDQAYTAVFIGTTFGAILILLVIDNLKTQMRLRRHD